MKFILISLLILLVPDLLFADEKITVLEVKGSGVSRSKAIQNGLIQALKQTEGVSIDVQKRITKSLLQKSRSQDKNKSNQVEVSSLSEGVVKEVTQGIIHEYRVLDAKKITDGEWEATLAVKMLRYKTPAISPHSRRKIAIIPFRTAYPVQVKPIVAQEISRQLNQKLVTEITQTRKFTVLDREYMQAILQEKNIILSADSPIAEKMKIGEILAVDYLLTGTITRIDIRRTPYKINATGEEGFNASASFAADYRIVVMATQQVKWSDSVTLTLKNAEIKNLGPVRITQALLNKAAQQIIRLAMDNIYPIKVVTTQANGEIILNQGGVTVSKNEIFDVFSAGKKIIDPYTGESLGSSESWVASIKISRVIPKMSYAKIIQGEYSLIKEGSICRRKTKTTKQSPVVSGRKSEVKSTPTGGVILPFD